VSSTHPVTAQPPASAETRSRQIALGAGAGLLLALALLKFGNPVVLEHLVATPQGPVEWWLSPWPVVFGYALLGVVVAMAIACARGLGRVRGWLAWLPVCWLAWQLLATLTSVDRELSWRVWIHHASVVACYYVGLLAVSRLRGAGATAFWGLLLVGFVWVLWRGFDQHYGGLEATRRLVYEQPGWQNLPEDYLKRLASNRVFSTLFYANTLAGVILLLMPGLATFVWHSWPERLRVCRAVSCGLLVYAGLACLVWSGSKAGWLIAALMGGVVGWWLPIRRRWRLALVWVGLGLALAVFGMRYQEYFERGATSAVARFEYWRVAGGVARERPVLGSGPGTFGRLFEQRKRPEAEMTRLVHNDYLQQTSDSGLPGGLMFVGWVLGALGWSYRTRLADPGVRALWLGLFGWGLQGFVEFGWYVPAVAWPATMLLGIIVGGGNIPIDKPRAGS
jgi:hypothetical protein